MISARLLDKLALHTGDRKYHQAAVLSQFFADPVQTTAYCKANPGEISDDLAEIITPFAAGSKEQ